MEEDYLRKGYSRMICFSWHSLLLGRFCPILTWASPGWPQPESWLRRGFLGGTMSSSKMFFTLVLLNCCTRGLLPFLQSYQALSWERSIIHSFIHYYLVSCARGNFPLYIKRSPEPHLLILPEGVLWPSFYSCLGALAEGCVTQPWKDKSFQPIWTGLACLPPRKSPWSCWALACHPFCLLSPFSSLLLSLPSSRCKPMIWTNLGILFQLIISSDFFLSQFAQKYHQSHVECSWCSDPPLSRYP